LVVGSIANNPIGLAANAHRVLALLDKRCVDHAEYVPVAADQPVDHPVRASARGNVYQVETEIKTYDR
jgi:hypothetical protein